MIVPSISVGMAVNYPGTGPDHDGGRAHRCVVVKDDDTNGNVYLLPICSFYETSDATCVLEAGCPVLGLTKKSFVAYYAAKAVSRKSFIEKLTSTEITHLGQMPQEILSRIVAGVSSSPDVEPWFRSAVTPASPRRILAG
jgi:hypothetical protein